MTKSAASEQHRKQRIAIIEDDPILRDHFVEIVSSAHDMDIAGVAASQLAGRNLAIQKPDLVLLDVGLPDGSGLDLIEPFKEEGESSVLVVTSFGDRDTVVAAIHAGADGYLLKDSTQDQIVSAIRDALAGLSPMSSAAAMYILDMIRSGEPLVEAAKDDEAAQLSPREVELLNLFARGLSYKEAATQMSISPLTVGNYVKTIYGKLAVHSRSEAVYEALKSGQLKI
ncbi:MAG: response regulator transcription factor [Pseudomonadota bacterium]